MNSRLDRLWKKFANKKYRDAFVESHLATNIAAQIFTLRDERGMSQHELAQAAGMKQSRICVLENPSNQSIAIKTLKRLASAFDVALVVRFVRFSELAQLAEEPSHTKFSVPSHEYDRLAAPRPIQIQNITISGRPDPIRRWERVPSTVSANVSHLAASMPNKQGTGTIYVQ